MSDLIVPSAARGVATPVTQDAIAPIPFCNFPDELLVYIFSLLGSVQDVNALGLTCRHLRAISTDEGVWKAFCQKHFSHVKVTDRYFSLYRECADLKRNAQFEIFGRRTMSKCVDKVYHLQTANGLLTVGTCEESQIWDIESETCLHRTKNPQGFMLTCQHVADGLLITGLTYRFRKYNRLKIWDMQSGDCLSTLDDLPNEIKGLAVIKNRLITVSKGKMLNIYDISDPANVRLLSSV